MNTEKSSVSFLLYPQMMYGTTIMKVKIRVEILADIPFNEITQEKLLDIQSNIAHSLYTDVDMSVYKDVIVRSIHTVRDNETIIP